MVDFRRLRLLDHLIRSTSRASDFQLQKDRIRAFAYLWQDSSPCHHKNITNDLFYECFDFIQFNVTGELNSVYQIFDSIAIDKQVFKQLNCKTEFLRLSELKHEIWMYPVPLCEVDEGTVCHAALTRNQEGVDENINLYERLKNLKKNCDSKQKSLIHKFNNFLPTII